ncbi:MAG: bifunctional 3-deoxy-7-phosphoheptulonate synthase/chorismate mutase type II [Bacteroidales bacterium]|jgi:chorismate mutase|nr:bifunctional 3-deoxy-7-phosphoheptulonate synthase/chorismate mutase type II [Bacteroidales bacterium]
MKNINIEPFSFPGCDMSRPVIIAGPCSAETEEQTLATAKELSALGVKIFRAGLWKPRTRPGAFEGVGVEGLPWMQKVKKETGMYVGTEVATAQHVFEALKYGIDFVWIGARTTANPFAVQEIADALRGARIPVMVKNPVNPDLELWIGALERINRAGITQIAAIHRGFSTYAKSEFRNHPQWLIPIELHRRLPELPILTDPSHIAGNRTLLAQICQQAMDINFNGLIVETHFRPDEAWSDAQQQITPQQLRQLIDSLKFRKHDIENIPRTVLDDLRMHIDDVDNQLIELLSERMKISKAIGIYKLENNITILQSRRYNEIIRDRNLKAVQKGLGGEFVDKIFETIHEESVLLQSKVMNSKLNNSSTNKIS